MAGVARAQENARRTREPTGCAGVRGAYTCIIRNMNRVNPPTGMVLPRPVSYAFPAEPNTARLRWLVPRRKLIAVEP